MMSSESKDKYTQRVERMSVWRAETERNAWKSRKEMCLESREYYEHGQYGVGLQLLSGMDKGGLAIQRNRRMGRSNRMGH